MPGPMSTRLVPPLLRIVAAAVGGAVLAGCAGTATVRLQTHDLQLRLDEYRIQPESVSVPPGRLRVTANNDGVLTHNVVLEYPHRDSGGNEVVIRAIPTMLPGATGRPVTVLLAPGRYLLVSNIANQTDLGMSATLIVRAH